MIDTLYNVSFCTGGHGSATCYTGNIQTTTNKNDVVTSIEFNICAASYIFSAATISAHFIMPAVLNFGNFLDI